MKEQKGLGQECLGMVHFLEAEQRYSKKEKSRLCPEAAVAADLTLLCLEALFPVFKKRVPLLSKVIHLTFRGVPSSAFLTSGAFQ